MTFGDDLRHAVRTYALLAALAAVTLLVAVGLHAVGQAVTP